jgi:hypothetical protein
MSNTQGLEPFPYKPIEDFVGDYISKQNFETSHIPFSNGIMQKITKAIF